MKILIAEADVDKFGPDRPIIIDQNTVITPSALDRASRLRIPVIRSSASPRAPQGESPAPHCDHCEISTLPDGTYLLTVSAGRKTVHAISPAGVTKWSGPESAGSAS
ncbi:MAG: hypothetical protein U1E76_12615 [Planctomycetota bacterium]